MSAKFEAEQAGLKETVAALAAQIMEKLTPAIVHEFIEKIVVYEPEQAQGDRRQKVEIIYNNIARLTRRAGQMPVFAKLNEEEFLPSPRQKFLDNRPFFRYTD